MNKWREKRFWLLFLFPCRSLQLPGKAILPTSLCLSIQLIHRRPTMAVKHLRLPGNYGCAEIVGSAAQTRDDTPQLAPHLHLPTAPLMTSVLSL